MNHPSLLRCHRAAVLVMIAASFGCGADTEIDTDTDAPEILPEETTQALRAPADGVEPLPAAAPDSVTPRPTRPDLPVKPKLPPRPRSCTVVQQPVRAAFAWTASADYDGDQRVDVATKRDNGEWSIDYAANGFGAWDVTYSGFGPGYFRPVPADYDGDCKADLATRDDSGAWYIDYAANGFAPDDGLWDAIYYGYGGPKAIPVPADYDGDGKVDLAVKDHVWGVWHIDQAADGFGVWNYSYPGYGGADYTPVPADYDGDGRADLSTKSEGGLWLIDHAANGFGPWDAVYPGFGGTDYAPVPADYDGDGKADLSTRDTWDRWFIDYARDGVGEAAWDEIRAGYGARSSYLPVPADYDGDQKADLASHTDAGLWLLDYASDGFGVWNASWNTFVTISAGTSLSPEDIRKFDSKWMQPRQMADAVGGAESALANRFGPASWGISERMTAMVRMYELTHEARYLEHLAQLANIVLLYRDDRHPGPAPGENPVDAELHRVRPRDEVRGLDGLAAWGGRSVNSGGLHVVDEAVSSLYAYPIAAFARLVAEHPDAQALYGDRVTELSDALLDTVAVFLPQVRTQAANGYTEARLINHPSFATSPTNAQCQTVYNVELATLPPNARQADKDRLKRMLNSCLDASDQAGHPLPHNIQNKFSMLLIELSRVLSTPYYQRRSTNAGAAWWRAQLPVLISQRQRYFANRMQTLGSDPTTSRFVWNYMDEVSSSVNTRYDDASHAGVSMGYLGLLNQNLARLSALPVLAREPIAFSGSDLKKYANTILFMTGSTGSVPPSAHIAYDVAGRAADPIDQQDGTCEGTVYMTAGDTRVYDVCHAISLRLTAGEQAHLNIANHSALLAHKKVRYPLRDPRLVFPDPSLVIGP